MGKVYTLSYKTPIPLTEISLLMLLDGKEIPGTFYASLFIVLFIFTTFMWSMSLFKAS